MFHLSDTQLHDYVDKELTPDAIVATDQHLAECAPCRSRLSSLADLEHQLQRLEDPEPQPKVYDRLMHSLRDRESRDRTPTDITSPSRWIVLARMRPWAIAASVAILIVAGIMLAPDLVSEASSLTFTPAMPARSNQIDIEYRSDGRFAEQTSLRLRSRYRRPGDLPYVTANTIATTLGRDGESRVLRGRIRLPDSVIYAVFAVEDGQGRVVDSHGHAGWEPAGARQSSSHLRGAGGWCRNDSICSVRTGRQLCRLNGWPQPSIRTSQARGMP